MYFYSLPLQEFEIKQYQGRHCRFVLSSKTFKTPVRLSIILVILSSFSLTSIKMCNIQKTVSRLSLIPLIAIHVLSFTHPPTFGFRLCFFQILGFKQFTKPDTRRILHS